MNLLLGVPPDDIFRFNSPNNYRDLSMLGDCQENVVKFAEMIGWKDDLKAIMKRVDAVDLDVLFASDGCSSKFEGREVLSTQKNECESNLVSNEDGKDLDAPLSEFE